MLDAIALGVAQNSLHLKDLSLHVLTNLEYQLPLTQHFSLKNVIVPLEDVIAFLLVQRRDLEVFLPAVGFQVEEA